MLPVFWISVFFFLRSGAALNHHTRHERTRYVSGRHQIYGGNFDHGNNYIPFVHYWERPLQVLESSLNVPKKLSSRPLFSWDFPAPISTYKTTKKVSTTDKPLQDASSLPEKPDEDVSIVTVGPTTIEKTRSDRLNRAKDSLLYEKPYSYASKKKKSSNRKKSIEESSSRAIKWRQSDAQSPGEFGNESYSKQPKRKKKGKKSKKGKTEKQIRKRNKMLEKVKHELNDGVNDVSGGPEYLEETQRAKKILKEKQKLVQMMKEPEIVSLCDRAEEKCEHRCKETDGKAVCVCFRGFAPLGSKCVDIDECETSNGGCNGKCINTIGSRKCVCSAGYRLFDGTCVDVNECLLRNGHGPCQDTCTNTMGSYVCSCEGLPGTRLAQNGHACEESDECDPRSSGCSHSCVSVAGRSFCTCPDGFELGDDWKTCHDIDECSNPEDYNVDCPTTCINTIGSYTCATTNSTTSEEENST